MGSFKTNLLKIAFDDTEDKPSVHKWETVMDEECQTDVELAGIIIFLKR